MLIKLHSNQGFKKTNANNLCEIHPPRSKDRKPTSKCLSTMWDHGTPNYLTPLCTYVDKLREFSIRDTSRFVLAKMKLYKITLKVEWDSLV